MSITTITSSVENSPLVLRLEPIINLTDEQFFEFCQINRELRIERTANGELLIMSPTGSDTGNRNFKLTVQLGIWADRDGTGIGFDSSTGFTLPNGAERSPDAAWIKLERWNALTTEQQKKFAPICPDFIVELRSASDNLAPLKTKMEEYINNGLKPFHSKTYDLENITTYLGLAILPLKQPTINGQTHQQKAAH